MEVSPHHGDLATAVVLPPSKARFALELICAVLLTILFAMLLGSALLRNHGFTAPALYEVIRVIFVYLVGLAATLAYARRSNLCVPGWWKENTLSYQGAMLVLALVLTFLTIQMLVSQGMEKDAASLLGLPDGINYVPVALFGIGISIISGMRFWAVWKGRLS